jgi:hypothetical protein
MPRQNIVFAVVAPLVLMAIIAVFVVVIGEALLVTHDWAQHLYHVGDYPTPEENRYWREMAALYPVGVAMAFSTVFLVGGIIASALAPQPPQQQH